MLTNIARLHCDLLQAQPLVARGERVFGMWVPLWATVSYKITLPCPTFAASLRSQTAIQHYHEISGPTSRSASVSTIGTIT